MYQCDHAEAWSSKTILAFVVAKSRIEHEQWLVPIQYATQVPDHLFFRRLLVDRVVRAAGLIPVRTVVSARITTIVRGVHRVT